MTNLVKAISNPLDKLQNHVFGAIGLGNPNNTLSQILDPARKLRNISDQGGGINTEAFLDPNNVFTQKNTTTTASKTQKAIDQQNAIPKAPNQDTAANSAQQQADYLRRRRGILGNIFGGNQANTAPISSGRTTLG